MKRLTLALALLIVVAGSGYASGTRLGAVVDDLVQPQPAAAVCAAGALSLAPSWYARGSVGGCGTRTVQVCGINTSGATNGCRTYTNYGTPTTYWSAKLNAAYGCSQRTWFWVSGIGSFQGASYQNIC